MVPFSREDETFQREALAFARIAYAEQEVPIGAVVVRQGHILGRGRNRRENLADPTHHAEIEALREAGAAAGTWRLDGATLYATLEPCAMCAGAAVNARIARIAFGPPDPKAGYCGTLGNIPQDPRLNHRCEVAGGLLAEECAGLLQQFFRAKREGKPENEHHEGVWAVPDPGRLRE
ncbi:MAG TPA: tRNA adenosine(34) deaminase TadA [Thermoanaerobaculia bacterium]|nr:tRNA adenosine(34) deaminase TadA [Thermoanaerobaculia bacterium]